MWNPQIAALCVVSLAVGDWRNDGFRTGIFATPAGLDYLRAKER